MIKNLKMHQISGTHEALGTKCQLQLFGTNDQWLLQQSMDLIDHYHDVFTVDRENSEIMDINHAAGKHPVQVSPTSYDLVKLAVEKSQENFGFNALIGPLVKLWGIGFADAHVPSDNQIKARMKLTDPWAVKLDDLNQTVFLEKPGMELDLGGIAKGYIADLLRDFWHAYGIQRGIINLGGNVLLVGDSPHNPLGLWNIGVQDPKLPRGENIRVVTVPECSAVTSGTYERVLVVNGKRYHHIIDPRTGYPVETNVAGVTLFTRDSVQAEIECKRLFFAGHPLKNWENKKAGRYGAVFVYNDETVYSTFD